MGKKIYISQANEEIKKNVLADGKCKECGIGYRLVVAKMYKREGFCGRECKRSFRRKKIKAEAAELRRSRQRRRQKNSKELDFYKTKEWRELRYKVLRHYGFKCMACGLDSKTSTLHVDHIKPRSKFPKLELVFDNLQVLCEDCNVGKTNAFDDDLRPAELAPDFLTDVARMYRCD